MKKILKDVVLIFFAHVGIVLLGIIIQLIFKKNLEESVKAVLLVTIPLWVFIIVMFFVAIIFYFLSNKKKKQDESILFDSNDSKIFDYSFFQRKLWDIPSKSEIGEKSEANIDFINGVITVQRLNINGRILLVIEKYKNPEIKQYLASDIAKEKRNISISFEAKIIGLPIELFIVFTPFKKGDWISHSNKKIINSNWEKFAFHLKIKTTENLTMRFEERKCTSLPCSYQIKNILIKEIVD